MQPCLFPVAPRIDVLNAAGKRDSAASERLRGIAAEFTEGASRNKIGFFSAWSTALQALAKSGRELALSPDAKQHIGLLIEHEARHIASVLRDRVGHPNATSLSRQLTRACEHLGIERDLIISQDEIDAGIRRGSWAASDGSAQRSIEEKITTLARELGKSAVSLREVLIATGVAPYDARAMADAALEGARAVFKEVDPKRHSL